MNHKEISSKKSGGNFTAALIGCTIIFSAARTSDLQRSKMFCLQTGRMSGIRRSRLF